MPAADIERAAHLYGEAKHACIAWGLGVTEQRYGSECVQLICNLALATGKIGREGCALMPMRGQNNVQGSSDMGALPDTFTGYRSVADDDVARTFEERWGVTMKRERGLKMPEMFDAAIEGRVKAMWICGYDIVQSDPDVEHVMEALDSLEFLVVQEIFENETTKFADVILPASSFLEKAGTFTNAERRMQLVRPAVEPPGAAKTDLEICKLISARLGHELPWDGPEDVMREIAELTPDFAGVTYERMEERGLQWPVEPDGTDAPMLCQTSFALPDGRARFAALPYKEPGDEASDEYPLILVTGTATGALQRRHDDAPDGQPRAVPERLARDPSRRRGGSRDRDGRRRGGAVEARRDHDRGADRRTDRRRPCLHRVPLPRGADEPPRRLLRRRRHELPRVQGDRRRRLEARRSGAKPEREATAVA